MHLYSLTSYKSLVCILYRLILLQAAQQVSLQKRSVEDSNNDQDLSNRTFDGPVIVLMSNDTVSIAQLPMILYGNLTEVYVLPDELQHQQQDEIQDQEDGEKEDARFVDEDDDDSTSARKAQHGIGFGADAREFEQMPHAMSVNTTTSLGKSEWQQIAGGGGSSGARDREEVSLPEQAGRKVARDGAATGSEEAKEGGDEEEDGREDERHLGRRPRSSNSLRDHDDDSSNGSGPARSVPSGPPNEKENNTNEEGDEQTPGGAQESNKQNVTSASSGHTQQQQQPNLTSTGGTNNNGAGVSGGHDAPAEDDDKIRRSSGASSSSQQPGPSRPATSSQGPQASSSSRVHFSDFDVHMSLGYAFVADSAGRIHRFKLPVGSKSSSVSRAGSKLRYASYNAKRTVPIGESVAIVNDEATNTIEAGSKFKFPPLQSRVVDAAAAATTGSSSGANTTNNDALLDANRHAGVGYDAARGYTDAKLGDSYDANRVRSEQSSGAAHEQTENEGQHPAISGGDQNSLSDTVRSDSQPVSGTSRLAFKHERRQGNNNFENLKQVDDVRPKIIWSRRKNAKRPSSSGNMETTSSTTGPYSAKQRAQQQLANAERALPHQEINHMVDAGQTTTNGRQSGAHPSTERTQQAQNDGYSGNEIQNEQRRSNACGATGQHKRLQSFAHQTEIAVDWLNNLLYVLDKCRLLVMDFEGNNVLLLIDDFKANNRPVDLKVDPVNDFLFWLQVGKFHNTIYKLDLSLLSMKSATSNGLQLRLRNNSTSNDSSGSNFDASDLVALVSHHYAHPIITNLPRHTRIFTIDHKHSRIYVPLTPSSSPSAGSGNPSDYSTSSSSTEDNQARRDDAEIFASTDDVTHLNNTQAEDSTYSAHTNCNHNETQTNEGQILAYNLDGTDVGPLRSLAERSHISAVEGIQDLTLNSEEGLLYWLINDGRDLFEEFRENSTIQPAQHYLYGKSYSKLIYFDDNNANQPTSQKSRFNVRNVIHFLSTSITSNRQTRGSETSLLDPGTMGSRMEKDANRNAPYIILGVTCLVVTTVYLIYALIFQRIQAQPVTQSHNHGGESLSGGSSIGTDSHIDDNLNGFVNSTTISRWVTGPSGRGTDASTFDRDINSFNRRLGAYDLESTNYEASNAIDEHYRGSTLNNQIHDQSTLPTTSQLANLSVWPTNMHDLSNKLYVPVEVIQDEALSSIPRVSIDQLEIARKAPLGEGHFGTVLQGTIVGAKHERRQRVNTPFKAPISPDSLAPPSRARMFAPSTSSSGHGSSSSTSCDFATANTDQSTTNRDDYLTPRNQLSSAASDYGVEMPASTSQDESCSGYCDTNEFEKLKVAIKKLKDNASSEEKRDFLQEAKLLASFNHPNIVELIGICLDRGSTLIIMELMLGGDLIRYMQESMPNQANKSANDLTNDDLIKICLDIANGCCYLEDMDYIHRDLAARNCLVSSRKREERVVKLADFGMARDIYKDSYYKKLQDSAMPLKWMAPECLKEQRFTKKSDVWSFGVVMWEVMGFCKHKPFLGVEPFFMHEHLVSGARLAQPDGCDDDMYKLMNRCWHLEPDQRPTFHECRAMLIEIGNKKNRNMGPL